MIKVDNDSLYVSYDHSFHPLERIPKYFISYVVSTLLLIKN